MVGTIGTLFAVASFFWFYHEAGKVAKNQAVWAAIGALSYFITRVLWTYGVFRTLVGATRYDHSANLSFWGGTTAILVAIAVVVLIKLRFLRKSG
ncbi:MAG: hypothetical protein ACRERS_00730 [Methylococcales bacterium]